MARIYRDLLVDEDDGKIRVNLLNRDGTVALHDVSMELSSPVAQEGDSFGAAAANLLLRLDEDGAPEVLPDVAIGVYAHAKTGKTHALTGKGNNIRFVAAADFTAGDTITVNGAACTAATLAGDALWTGFWRKGAVVTCYRAGDALTFSGAGLSAADKAQLVPGNLLESVRLRSGGVDVVGGIPIRDTTVVTVPMFSTSPMSIPAGYYPQGVTMTPVYVTGTEFTDFSATGYFGSVKTFCWGGSNTVSLKQASAGANGVYISAHNVCEPDGQAAYGGFAAVCFQTPFAHDYDYAVVTCTGRAAIRFTAGPVTDVPKWTSWPATGAGSVRIPYSKSTPYLSVGLDVNGTAAWAESDSAMSLTKITFYKNAT